MGLTSRLTAVCLLLPGLISGWSNLLPGQQRLPSTLLRRGVAASEGLFQADISEWDTDISAIATRYLQGKYTACDIDGENCRAFCDRDEIKKVLTEILPPVSTGELEGEVVEIMNTFKGAEVIDMTEFIDALKTNKYWADAGELVVKELMYLDCLQSNYASKKALLSDDDYDELKSSLTWDGSEIVNMSGDEARFLYAIAANRKGEAAMPDAEYASLKAKLQDEGSWVTSRAQDPLEKLGLNTFLGYIHRSFRK